MPNKPNDTERIVDYLNKHGPMSLCDICADLGVAELDVGIAAGELLRTEDAEDPSIRRYRAYPLPVGAGAWYTAR